jgi:hypothetical protein
MRSYDMVEYRRLQATDGGLQTADTHRALVIIIIRTAIVIDPDLPYGIPPPACCLFSASRLRLYVTSAKTAHMLALYPYRPGSACRASRTGRGRGVTSRRRRG